MFARLKKSKQQKAVEAASVNADQVQTTSPATADVFVEPPGANTPWAPPLELLQPGNAVTLPAKPVVVYEPVAVPEPTKAAEPTNPDELPIDWREEQRTDLPPRTPGRIAYLLRYESPAQTKARITNDYLRVANRRG